ncbi:MAG: acyl-CoA thioesterase [Ignavibacteriaceae bacterium]|nr:acyl-CoA thioesterase [Ignavibacteriaceae bacterium]
MDIKDFKHRTSVTVRFHEVDMLGVCNNAVYLNYFEYARLQYIKDLGLLPEAGIFTDGDVYFMVRNEINYKSHGFYDEKLVIHSRISFIKNSSYGFEHIIIKDRTGEIVADGAGVFVHVDAKTKKPILIKQKMIEVVKNYEPDVKILREGNH